MKEPLNFDVDHYLNRIIPYSRLYLLPKPISRFLGYRASPPPRIGNVLIWWWSFIGAFVGILIVEAIFQTEAFRAEGTPIVIASLGAAAILEYQTIESPLAQPRNSILGQTISAIIGVSITKLFQHSPHFESLRWVAGALSVGVASAAMGITKTVHPPAGATALLCATSPDITALGWFLLPLIILGSSLLVAVGCVLNNIQRQFPLYWWTPADITKKRAGMDDIERAPTAENRKEGEEAGRPSSETYDIEADCKIMIDTERIVVPDWLQLAYEERQMLEMFRNKLREGLGRTGTRESNAMHHHESSNALE